MESCEDAVGVLHQDACLFLPGVLTPEIPARPSELEARNPAEMHPAGAVYIASHSFPRGPRQGDCKSRTTLQRRNQRTARLYHCHDNRGRRPVGSPVSPVPSRRAPQLSPAPPDPARPSSAHLPGAPRPEHLFSPSLRPPGRAPRPRTHRSLPGPEDWPGLRFWPPCSGR